MMTADAGDSIRSGPWIALAGPGARDETLRYLSRHPDPSFARPGPNAAVEPRKVVRAMSRKNLSSNIAAQVLERVDQQILLDILGMVIDRLAGEDTKARAEAQKLWRRYGPQMMQELRQQRIQHPQRRYAS